jgi:hypothetical protein
LHETVARRGGRSRGFRLSRRLTLLAVGVLVCACGVLAVSAAAATHDPNLATAMALVRKQCPAPYAEIATNQWQSGVAFNALYGNCHAGDGTDQHVWLFQGGHLIGMDTSEPDSSREIIGLWRDLDTIAFMYVLYRAGDPNCCPRGGGAVVRFVLRNRHVVRLDRLPPHQLGSVPLGR